MASYCAVAVAAFFQIILRVSFFIEQRSDLCSTAPTLGSWIFLIAFLDILLDICIYPVRYMHLPYICQIVAETIVTVFLTEFGTLVVWCEIEKITCKLCKSILQLIQISPNFYYAWENYILGTVTTLTSLAILLFATEATDHFHFLRKKSFRLCRKINSKSLDTWYKMRSLMASRPNTSCPTVPQSDEAESYSLETEILYNPRRNNKRSRTPRKRTPSRSNRKRRQNV